MQRRVQECEAEAAALRTGEDLAALSLRRRDEEIARLQRQAEEGRGQDGAALALRNETNESIILSLNEQVGG